MASLAHKSDDLAVLVEWAERLGPLLPADRLTVTLTAEAEGLFVVIDPARAWEYFGRARGEAAPLDGRSIVLASYALSGFSNFASIAIQIGGIAPMAPSRRHDIARLGLKAMIGGALASYLLGDSITQFSTVIGTYLFAMGIGSWLSRFIVRGLVARFVVVEIMVGLVGGFSSALLFLAFGYSTSFHLVLYLLVLIGIRIATLSEGRT